MHIAKSGAMAVLLLQTLTVGCIPAVNSSDDSVEDLLPSMQVYTAGEEVTFVLQVTNTTDSAVELSFPTAQTYDFIVSQGGSEVWRWSEGQMFAQAIQEIRVEASETLRYEAEWRVPPSAAGEFEVRGVVPASGEHVEQATRFEVP